MKENVQRKTTMKEVLGNKADHGRPRPLPLPLPPRQGSFRLIKTDDKFFSRLLSKETSLANPSFRVYYGGKPSSIPFVWETQPGTPKHVLHDDPLPPLTPPPSYYAKSGGEHCLTPAAKKNGRSSLSLFSTLVLRKPKKGRAVYSSASLDFSSSTMSTSSSSSSLAMHMHNSSKQRGDGRRGPRFLSQGSMSFDSRVDDEEVTPSGQPSPTSSSRFGASKKWHSLSNVGRCFSPNF